MTKEIGMKPEDENFLSGFLNDSRDSLRDFACAPDVFETLSKFADVIQGSFDRGGKLMIVGNGGSAGDAQHIACEFVTRMLSERSPLPAISLSADSSVITASGNDYGFEFIYERQVRAIGRDGDVLLAMSTSGKSANILHALRAARAMNIATLGFAGPAGGPMADICDCVLSPVAPRNFLVQQIHMVAAHAICGLLEHRLFGKS